MGFQRASEGFWKGSRGAPLCCLTPTPPETSLASFAFPPPSSSKADRQVSRFNAPSEKLKHCGGSDRQEDPLASQTSVRDPWSFRSQKKKKKSSQVLLTKTVGVCVWGGFFCPTKVFAHLIVTLNGRSLWQHFINTSDEDKRSDLENFPTVLYSVPEQETVMQSWGITHFKAPTLCRSHLRYVSPTVTCASGVSVNSSRSKKSPSLTSLLALRFRNRGPQRLWEWVLCDDTEAVMSCLLDFQMMIFFSNEFH